MHGIRVLGSGCGVPFGRVELRVGLRWLPEPKTFIEAPYGTIRVLKGSLEGSFQGLMG